MNDFFSSDDEPTQVFPAIDGGGPAADHSRQGVAEAPVDLGKLSPWSSQPETSFDEASAVESTDYQVTTSTAVATMGEAAAQSVSEPIAMPPPSVVLPPAHTEDVTCPACGTVAVVTLTRRESADFCRNCDYPLFWTPAKIVVDRSGLSEDSLRRLPGTVGRVTVASFPCPYCAEPNQVTAIDCIRCGRPLRPVHFEPPPPMPMYLPEPIEPEPEPGIPWWVWLLIVGVLIAGVIAIMAVYGVFD
jgi:hypothetical protein